MEKSKLYSIIHSIYKGKTNNTFHQLIRYTFVGGLAFIIDFSTLFFLTNYLNLYYLISAGIAFLLGLTTNYLLSISWVFARRTVENRKLEFMLFMLIGIIGLALNELFLWFFTDILLMYYLISKIITTFFIYLWNFFARKFILFNK